jgi:hypothetical protein
MKFKIIILLFFVVTLLLSCSGGHKSEDMEAGMAMNMTSPPPPPGTEEDAGAVVNDPLPKPIEQKLIKNGEVSFKVKSLADTKQNVQKVLASFSGYIAKENNYGGNENPYENLIVRVPNKNFDKFLEQVLIGAEEIDSKNINIDDVTEQFVDIEARLKNKKQLETKYQEILAKADKIEDILKIEKEISLIREDIEASEGRLKYLNNQVSYSTISLRYYEKRTSGFNFGGKLGNAISNGSYGFLSFLIIMVNLWPLWLIGGVTWFLIVRAIRKNRKKKMQGVQ